MPKSAFFGVGSKAKKVSKYYFGVGSKAKKVKSGFIGIAGKAKQFYSAIPVNPNTGLYFAYVGTNDGNHLLKLSTSGITTEITLKGMPSSYYFPSWASNQRNISFIAGNSGNELYILAHKFSSPFDDKVFAINPSTGAYIREVYKVYTPSYSGTTSAYGISGAADNRLLVSNNPENMTLSIIDTTVGALLVEINFISHFPEKELEIPNGDSCNKNITMVREGSAFYSFDINEFTKVGTFNMQGSAHLLNTQLSMTENRKILTLRDESVSRITIGERTMTSTATIIRWSYNLSPSMRGILERSIAQISQAT